MKVDSKYGMRPIQIKVLIHRVQIKRLIQSSITKPRTFEEKWVHFGLFLELYEIYICCRTETILDDSLKN